MCVCIQLLDAMGPKHVRWPSGGERNVAVACAGITKCFCGDASSRLSFGSFASVRSTLGGDNNWIPAICLYCRMKVDLDVIFLSSCLWCCSIVFPVPICVPITTHGDFEFVSLVRLSGLKFLRRLARVSSSLSEGDLRHLVSECRQVLAAFAVSRRVVYSGI